MAEPSIYGALTDPQFYGDVKQRLVDALRGGVQDVFPTGVSPTSSLAQQGVPVDPAYHEKMLNLGLAGLTVYHGSPHKFDKFDMSKIGTGEGAQAYGHGLYVAENPGTAMSYKEGLSRGKNATLEGGGNKVELPPWLAEKIKQSPEQLDSAIADWKGRIEHENLNYHISPQPWLVEERINGLQKQLDGMLSVKAAGGGKVEMPGQLYKADLPDEAVARMLDWDKPLSQQAPQVQRIIKGEYPHFWEHSGYDEKLVYPDAPGGAKRYGVLADAMDGEAFYHLHNRNAGMNPPDATKTLQGLGIPGIKYADAMSRGTGAGTSNYVLFDDSLARILERNAQPTGQVPWATGEWQPPALMPSQQAAAQLKQSLAAP